MSSPATRGTGTPKRHPACPGKSRCQLQGCVHNAFTMPGNEISIHLHEVNGKLGNEISIHLHEVNGKLGAYPFIRFAGGLSYQRLGAAYEVNNEPKEAIGMMMHIAQTKIREVSDIVLDRVRSCLSYEMPM